MATSKAFTLRDMVALIILIVLPLPLAVASIQSAREGVKSATCAMNLANLARATQLYVQANRGYLMTLKNNVSPLYKTQAGQQPSETTYAYGSFLDINNDGILEPRQADPNTGLSTDVRSWGFLYTGKYLKEIRAGETFYCPGKGIVKTNYLKRTYPNPWGTKSTAPSSLLRTGYMFNPWEKYAGTSGSYPYSYEDDLIFARHPQNRFIVGDLIWGSDVTAHVSGSSATWNLAYPDGHVATLTSDSSDPNSLWYLISVTLQSSIPAIDAQPMTKWGVADANGQPYQPDPSTTYLIRKYLPGG